MTDLHATLPNFSTQSYTHLLPSIEKNRITTTDLVTLDSLEIAKRARVPLLDVKRFIAHVLAALRADLGIRGIGQDVESERQFEDLPREGDAGWGRLRCDGRELAGKTFDQISLGDSQLDRVFGGGIPTGYITEIVGERFVCALQPHKTQRTLLTRAFVPSQRCRKDAIAPSSPPRSPTAPSQRPKPSNALHINRTPPTHHSPGPDPPLQPNLHHPSQSRPSNPGPYSKHPDPRPRKPGPHPPIPTTRRTPTAQHRPRRHRQHRRQLPRRKGRRARSRSAGLALRTAREARRAAEISDDRTRLRHRRG